MVVIVVDLEKVSFTLKMLQRETFGNFLVTRFMEGMSDVFLFTFFSLSLIFTLVATSIPSLQNVMFFLQQKMSPFVFFLSGSSSFSR